MELRACRFEKLELDPGLRRGDECKALSLFVIPAPYRVRDELQPESSVVKEDFEEIVSSLCKRETGRDFRKP